MKILPSLQGKIASYQMRVPTSCVSCAFIDIEFQKDICKEKIERWLTQLDPRILAVNKDDLVSKDFCGNKYSAIIDLRRFSINKNELKLLAWYDNEMGYASRVMDLILLIKNKSHDVDGIINKENDKKRDTNVS